MIISSYIIYTFLLPFSAVYLLLILSFFERSEGGKGADVGLDTGKSNIVKVRDAALVASAIDIVAIIDEVDSYINYGNFDLLLESNPAWGLIASVSLLISHILFFIYTVKHDIDGRLAKKTSFSERNGQKYQIIDKVINIYILIALVGTNAVTMRHIYGVLQ